MLQPRLIPVLLLKNKGAYKTVNFTSPRYLGDPLNLIRIFNEKKVDEILILDIDATVGNTFNDINFIKKLAYEAEMPSAYGGGINSVQRAKEIISCGFEKVTISSCALNNLPFLKKLSSQIGKQSIVIILDIKLSNGKYSIYTHNAKTKLHKPLEEAFTEVSKYAGEIVINSIDNDGKMSGYDLSLASKISQMASTPITFLGGASSLQDFKIITDFNNFSAAASSFFVFQGKLNAVLPSYPTNSQKYNFLIGNREI